MENNVSDAAKRLKKLREAAGLSQRELCKRIGWGSGRISDYERGVRKPKVETVELIEKHIY